MKPVKCPNDHFYDAERFSECPHCKKMASKSAQTENTSGASAAEPKGKATPSEHSEERKPFWFSRKEKKHTVSERRPMEDDSDDYVELPSSEGCFQQREETVSLFETQPIQIPSDLIEEESSAQDQYEDVYSSTHEESSVEGKKGASQLHTPVEKKTDSTPIEKTEPVSSKSVTPLQRAVSATGAAAVSSDSKTIGLFSVDNGSEPVVGWLVCVKGQYMGECFNLKSGRNNIGRSLGMDVPLAKEASVSRDRHAVITFEPYKRTFILQAGESNGLTYHNGELVVTYVTLKNYDTIQLGQAEFKFMAFCSEEFSWEDYLGK